MSEKSEGRLIEGSTERMRAATADLCHHYRIRNIVLAIVGIGVCVCFVLRAWSAF